MIAAGAVASFSFNWKFVFLVCLVFCLATAGLFLAGNGSWSTLLKMWSAIVVFQLSYFGVALLKHVVQEARRAKRQREAERDGSRGFDRIDVR